MKTRNILILVLIVLTSCKTIKLAPDLAIQKFGANPYREIDGQPVTRDEFNKYDPKKVSSLATYYDKDATRSFGLKARDGAIIVESKAFDKNKYEAFFKKYSKEYEKMLTDYDSGEILYILNDRIQTGNFEGNLACITKRLLKDIKIIDQKELLGKYQVKDKKIGVVIRANPPKNLYNAKKNFK